MSPPHRNDGSMGMGVWLSAPLYLRTPWVGLCGKGAARRKCSGGIEARQLGQRRRGGCPSHAVGPRGPEADEWLDGDQRRLAKPFEYVLKVVIVAKGCHPPPVARPSTGGIAGEGRKILVRLGFEIS